MTNDPSDMQRRMLFQVAAGMAPIGPLGLSIANAAPAVPAATGRAGDFEDRAVGRQAAGQKQTLKSSAFLVGYNA